MARLKRYKSKGVLSVSVGTGDGLSAYVRFSARVDGSGLFVTTDTGLQQALERHPKFGRLFVADGEETVDKETTEPRVSYSVADIGDIVEQAAERSEELAAAIQEASGAVSDIQSAGADALSAIEEAIQGIEIHYDVIS